MSLNKPFRPRLSRPSANEQEGCKPISFCSIPKELRKNEKGFKAHSPKTEKSEDEQALSFIAPHLLKSK